MLYKRRKRKLNKFGKICFSTFIILIIGVTGLFLNFSKPIFYEKEENDNYLVEINYPKVANKNLTSYSNNYIKKKEKEFKDDINEIIGISSAKYEFKTNSEVIETEDILGVHLTVYEYMGGAHYIRDDKSYYYSKHEDKMISIEDFLENDKSLEKLSNISYYYIMEYSNNNNLGFNEEMVKDGLKYEINNFEHFNFTDNGLEIMFPPLQVAYYAAGEVKILIPYSELKGVIKDKYLKHSTEDKIPNNNSRNLKQFSNKKLIAFTFDDGPSYTATNKLLDNLDKYDARVTFFVLGNRVNDYKDTLKRAYDMGNLIGNHTYSHSNLLNLDNYSIISEIKRTNDAIRNITSSETSYLRPPYGNTSIELKDLSNMYTILWNLDTEDWKYKDAEKIADYITQNAHDGAIILLHDIYETSVDGAVMAMERLEKEGYAFVTIEEMAMLKNIQLDKSKDYYQINN